MTRQLISLFANQNPLYAGATVTFLAVDESGDLTGANIALYTTLGGSTQATNPQTLNASGMLAAPLYFEDAHKVRIVRAAVGIDTTSGVFQPAGAGSGVESFVDLDDVPASYSGQGGKQVRVNSGATALEFVTPPTIPTTLAGLDAPAYAGNARRILALDATPAPAWVRNVGHDLAGEVVIGDANGAAVVGTTPRVIRQSGTLTAARTYAMPAQVNGYAGLQYRLVREGGGNFSWTITGLGASGSGTLSLDAAGDSAIVEFSGGAFRAAKSSLAISEPQDLNGLIDDGVTDNSVALKSLIDGWVTDGVLKGRITGRDNGLSAIRISSRVVVDAMPPVVEVSRARFIFDADTQAGIYIRGQQIELPDVGKAKLYADVDVSGGAVATFDIDVSANTSIVSLLVPGAIVIIRGENGSDGDVLDGHRHEAEVVSCILVSGTRYTLTITPGLPASIPGGIWKTVWPGSQHATQPDETLISVLAMARATADMTDSRIMSIESGKAAAMGLAAGQWVEVVDDAVGADSHGTSSEPLHKQTVRIAHVEAGIDPIDDTITFDEPVRGALTTAQNARLIMLRHCPQFKFQGPGPAFPIRVIGTPPAAPASRRHLIEVKYAISPEITGWFYEYVAADGSTRGAPIRDSNCYEPWVHHNGVVNPWPDFAGAFTGGDYYCAWSKGSTRPLYEFNTFLGGRHSLVIANAKGPVVRFNRLGYSGFQCLDFHGENEIDVEAYGNRIVRGPKWTDRTRHVAIQLGNQTHTFGTHGALIHDNIITGFDAAEDVGVLVVSGCTDIIVDQDFRHPVGEAVRIEADRRAPTVAIEGITIRGSIADATTAGVVISGAMPPWLEDDVFEGSASRPTYCEAPDGSVWSTPDNGTAGATSPVLSGSPQVDVDTHYDGALTWTLRALAPLTPVQDVVIRDLVVAGAAVAFVCHRVGRLRVMDSLLVAASGGMLTDCHGVRLQNIAAAIGPSGTDDWLVDLGGNFGGEYRLVDAGGGGVDDIGGSNIVDAVSSGAQPSGIQAFLNTTVQISSVATVVNRGMRQAVTSGDQALVQEVELALDTTGTVRVTKTALAGDVWSLRHVGGSAEALLDVEDDAGTINGSVGPLTLAPGALYTLKCVSVDGGTGDRAFEIDGPLVGVASTAHGPLAAADPPTGQQRYTLGGFSALVETSRSVAASATFDAGDAGRVMTVTGAATLTIPANATVAYPVGTVLAAYVDTAAAVSLAIATGVVHPLAGRTLTAAGRYSHIGARKVAAPDEWVAVGDFASS